MNNIVVIDALRMEWNNPNTKEDPKNAEYENIDICGVYETVTDRELNEHQPVKSLPDLTALETEEINTTVKPTGEALNAVFSQISETVVSSLKTHVPEVDRSNSEYLQTHKENENSEEVSRLTTVKKKTFKPITNDKVICKRKISSTRKSTTEDELKTKLPDENLTTNVPSVYSCAQIKRHEKRLKLKALEENSDSESDSNAYEGDDDLDPDLDINLRIFEETAKSVSNVIIGEIQCGVMDDKCNIEESTEKTNKNTNVFKLSVNASFSEKTSNENKTKCDIVAQKRITAIFDDEEDLFSDLSSDFFFSGDDSDLEILTSKPIVRKRTTLPIKKEKQVDNDKKLTMYDLIYNPVSPTPRIIDEDSDTEQKNDQKKKESKKVKHVEEKTKTKNVEKIENEKSETAKNETRNESLPVPQLKVGPDGQVVIDMDSLVIEQTGVAKARDAIANSEIIEECELNFTSYNKKCGYRKQWSPHDTLKFYDVLSAIGTDFTLMATLFPGRTRNCMKRKFKKEEKINSDLVLKALTCKQKFDIGLLEKELKKKEERVNLLRKNSKKEKIQKTKKVEGNKKTAKQWKRRSFFERGISCFQNS